MRVLVLAFLSLSVARVAVAEDDPAVRFQAALHAEVVRGDPLRALTGYRALASSAKGSLAAQAQLAIGRCLQTLGRDTEALAALDQVLRRYPGERQVLGQALQMIQAYKDEAERALVLWRQVERLRAAKRQLEAQLAAAAGAAQAVEQGRSELRALRTKLTTLQDRLTTLEAEKARRPEAAGQLLRELSQREGEHRKIAATLAEHYLRAATADSGEGRYREALRHLLLAREYLPDDPRIAARLAAVRELLGAADPRQLEALRAEADRLRGRLERRLADSRKALERIEGLAAKQPREALADVRRLLRELPASLQSSSLADQARGRVVELMTRLARQTAPRRPPLTLPGGDDALAIYALPPAEPSRAIPTGGVRRLVLDRQLRTVRRDPFQPPTADLRRRQLLDELARLVRLDDAGAARFAIARQGHLIVLADGAGQAEIARRLARIGAGLDQLYQVRARLIQIAPGASVPWSGWAEPPHAAGDGSYLVFDAAARQALDGRLADRADWRTTEVGPLQLWGRQRSALEVSARNVFLVGYETGPSAGGAPPAPRVRTLVEGLTLAVGALSSPTTIRLELTLEVQRIGRPVPTMRTANGRIQLPVRARQTIQVAAEVPRDGALLLCGVTDPITLTHELPGQLALLLEPRTLAEPAPPVGRVRRLPLGRLRHPARPQPVPRLGGRTPMPTRDDVLRSWLKGADPQLTVQLIDGALIAGGPPESLAAVRQRLTRLERHAALAVAFSVRGWSLDRKTLESLAGLAGRPELTRGGGLVSIILEPERGRQLLQQLAQVKGAPHLPLPAGPYPGRGTEQLVASRLTHTRFVRDPGTADRPPEYGEVTEGVVLSLVALPADVVDINFQVAKLRALAPVRRPGGLGFEPRRSLISGHISPALPLGAWALVTGLSDPSDPSRTLLLLIHRDAPKTGARK